MASLALAELGDLEARMGPQSDVPRAQAAIDDASSAIHAETNNAWIADGELVANIPGVAKAVCCSVARRVLSNPQGLTSQTLGPATEQMANASADVYLTKNEKRLLRRGLGGTSGTIQIDARIPW